MNKLLACLLSISLSAVFAALPVVPAAAQQLQSLDRIVAVVNEDVILRSELDRAMANILSQYAGRQDQLPPRDVLERQVLERLVLSRLQVARAEVNGIVVSDEEVEAAIANVGQQNNVDAAQLQAQLARDGMTIDDLRSSIRDELASQRLRQSFARSRISVSEGEVDAALAAQGGGQQYHLAHIMVSVPEGATAAQIEVGQKKVDDIKTQIEQGQIDFAAAAVRFSDSPNALEGGDLGWRGLDQIPPSFAQTISSMQPGQVIGPIRGPSGFQLLQLLEARDASAATAATISQYRARHILVRAEDGADDAAAKARIDTLRARIAGGADFAEVAKQDSDDSDTADKGGELGWFAQDAHGVDFGAQVAALQDGQVSQPFKTQVGWEIVERQGNRQQVAGDENQRQQVRESIGQRKLEEEWDRFLREMRGEAFVDIRLPGSSAPTPAPADGG